MFFWIDYVCLIRSYIGQTVGIELKLNGTYFDFDIHEPTIDISVGYIRGCFRLGIETPNRVYNQYIWIMCMN